MAQERIQRIKEQEKGIEFPKQRAIIFQGGGALGAYEAGAYRVLYDWISRHIENKDENVFDVIAGTSIGALNGAIITSHFLEKKNADVNKSLSRYEYWKGSANTLEKFWQDVQTKYFFTDWLDLNFLPWDLFHTTIKEMKKGWISMLERAEESMPYIKYNPFIKEWLSLLQFVTEAWDIPASTEAARRYWTTRTLGAPNVAAAIPRWDFKYGDVSHGFRFRGEQRRLPFWWFYPTLSLKESCRNYINFPIKTDYRKGEPRFLLVTVDVQSGDTVSIDSNNDNTEYDEYDEWKDYDNKPKEEYHHVIRYPNGIEWDQLSTTFSMPDLYRHTVLQDEQSGKKRTFWDGGVLSNTPLRELIDRHKDYWKKEIGEERLWSGMNEEKGEKKIKIPALDVYIVDVWPAKLSDDPVPSDNDFVASRKTDLILLDKTEYEESVSKMITHYMHLTEMLLSSLNDTDKSNKIEDILNKPIIDSTVNTKNKKTYRDLLKGNFDINRVMRIERKDDLYTMGYAMEDFSARSMNQLLELGKHDALDKLIHSLCNMIEIIFYDDKTPPQVSDKNKTKNSLHKHLEKANELLQRKENDYYQEIMNHLYDFADEVNRMELDGELSQDNANLLRP
jgi:predicted acylesterase/phospholipase RssA